MVSQVDYIIATACLFISLILNFGVEWWVNLLGFINWVIVIEQKRVALHLYFFLRNTLIHYHEFRCVLSDFGLAYKVGFNDEKSYADIISPRWSSPELIQNRTRTFESDVWALGKFCAPDIPPCFLRFQNGKIFSHFT